MKPPAYKTRQKQEILSFLQSLDGKHVTAGDIADHLARSGNPVGLTTIYRYLDRLTGEGRVHRYQIDGNASACYAYIGDGETCREHFHFKCEQCGELIHFTCDALDDLQRHLAEEHGFDLNSLRTVFYGVCSRCAQEKRKNAK